MTVHASFARPMGMFDNTYNKIVAWFTGGSYCHSELIFSFTEAQITHFLSSLDGHDKLKNRVPKYMEDGVVHICFYIVWGDQCSYRLMKKRHNNPFYKFPCEPQFSLIELNTFNETEEFKMCRFLCDQCKKEYDYIGAMTYFLPYRGRQAVYPTYFCSQLMVSTFQHVQKFKDINPSSITPNKLYNMLLTN